MSSHGSSQSSPSLTPPATMFPLSSSPPRSVDIGSSSDSTSHRSSPRTPSPLNPHHNHSLTPPGRSSLLPHTPPPTAARGRLRSYSPRERSPVRDATLPVIPISRVASAPAAPQSTTGFSAHLPVSASPATSSPALFPFTLHRSPASSPERGGGHESDGDGTPASTWWSHRIHSPRPWAEPSKRKRTIPVEQAEGYIHTRSVSPHCTPSFFSSDAHTVAPSSV